MNLPLARTEKLTVRELPEETLVYDLVCHKSHCLNRTAALVWKHCDGQTTVAEMAALLQEELGLPADHHVVRLALEQLGRRHLLQGEMTPLSTKARMTRRDALKKIAVVAAALPIVMTLTAKPARASASTKANCTECENASSTGGIFPFTCAPFAAGTKCSKGVCDGKGNCVAQLTCGGQSASCTGTSGTQGSCCQNCFCEPTGSGPTGMACSC